MINIKRHQGIFDPSKTDSKKIAVIGCGAIGSKIVVALTKLGVTDLDVYDFDKVEDHNISNQAFSTKHIGMLKVEAIKDYVYGDNKININIFNEKCNKEIIMIKNYNIVFLAVDSIEGRKELVDALTRNPSLEYIIETRMGSDEVQINGIAGRLQYKQWLSTIDFDEEYVEVSACGSPISFGLISDMAATLATNMFVHHINGARTYDRVSMFSYPLDLETSNY